MSAPPLPLLRGAFPYRIAAPSFVIPGSYQANAELLAGAVDAVELLFFESRPGHSLPQRGEIEALGALARERKLDYLLHLPIDLQLGSVDPAVRAESRRRLLGVWELGRSLRPAQVVLHLEPGPLQAEERGDWVARAAAEVEALLAAGCDPRRLCLETLDFGVEAPAEVAARCDVRLALDLGHALRDGLPALELLERHARRADLLHLHGVAAGRDHLSLEALDSAWLQRLAASLRAQAFAGVLCIEVFEAAALARSLQRWEGAWNDPASQLPS